MRKFLIITTSLAGLLAAGAIDFFTGNEVLAFPLYFLPLSLAAWQLGKWTNLTLVLLATAVAATSSFLVGLNYASPFAFPVNLLALLVTFGLVSALLFHTRQLLEKEKLAAATDAVTGLYNRRGFEPLLRFAAAT